MKYCQNKKNLVDVKHMIFEMSVLVDCIDNRLFETAVGSTNGLEDSEMKQ